MTSLPPPPNANPFRKLEHQIKLLRFLTERHEECAGTEFGPFYKKQARKVLVEMTASIAEIANLTRD